jgi:putative nucleotide binding protein
LTESREKTSRQLYEEYGYIIDYIPYGKPGVRTKFRSGTTIQVIGEKYFTLLEAILKEGIIMKILDKIYVGKNQRKEVEYIIGRIGYGDLTANAKVELEHVVEKIVMSREQWVVNFFNSAPPITPRMHSLELIPGIGKKYMWKILDAREKKKFQSFEDLQNRTELFNPAKGIAKRVNHELTGESKYQLFVRIP